MELIEPSGSTPIQTIGARLENVTGTRLGRQERARALLHQLFEMLPVPLDFAFDPFALGHVEHRTNQSPQTALVIEQRRLVKNHQTSLAPGARHLCFVDLQLRVLHQSEIVRMVDLGQFALPREFEDVLSTSSLAILPWNFSNAALTPR